MWSTSGRSSRSTFTLTKWRFITAAMSGFSKDSRSMTWHQWHGEYPTESSTGLSSARARANASSPHGYQSTGLCACCSRYGLLSRARRLSPTGIPAASAPERQPGEGGRHRRVADAHGDASAGLVLATDERQRDRPTETERPRGARHPPHGRAADLDRRAGGRHGLALDEQAAQQPVDVASIADAHDD